MPLAIRFDRGTLELEGPAHALPGVLVDARSRSFRAAAHRLGAIMEEAHAAGIETVVDAPLRWPAAPRAITELALRDYQEQALMAWRTANRRGLVCLPTGAGKTRIALAAILETGLPAAVLAPTRALVAQWVAELERHVGSTIGVVGDGERRIERITVFTFESAYRHMDLLGDRFGLVVVDEAHHFGSGARIEALESCAATARLGLTATAPAASTTEMDRLVDVIGHVVFEIGHDALVGTHLANVRIIREVVSLDPEEREAYARLLRPFNELSRAFFRANFGADFAALTSTIGGTAEGRGALRDRAAAEMLASFPRAKRQRVGELLARHRDDRCIVFTAFARNAYALAADNLVPVIAAETSARERLDVLRRFRDGPIRTIVSARVLNEGLDVPDARVAIIVAGTQGPREHVQRIGRVLRPRPGKEAQVYELVTSRTSDSRRAARRAGYAPRSAP